MYSIFKSIDYHFLVRIIDNDVTPEEKEFFEQWLSESEKNRELFSEVSLLLDKVETSRLPSLPDKDLQWQKISQKIYLSETDTSGNSIPDLQKNLNSRVNDNYYQIDGYQTGYWKGIFSSRILQFAALLLIVSSFGLYFLGTKVFKNKPAAISSVQNVSRISEVITHRGEKLAITLSDGSKVYLNNLSKITFPESFNETSRNIELEGEAYFAVAPNNFKPFTVRCGNVVTVVKGTEFNIRNRAESIKVVVVNGLVETYSPRSEEIFNLKKGDLLSYNEQSGFSLPHKVKLQHYLAWRNDKFSFSKTPLTEVMGELERYYNLNVTFKADSLKRKTITGFFSSDSLNRILSIISLTLDLKIKLNNRNIIIDKY